MLTVHKLSEENVLYFHPTHSTVISFNDAEVVVIEDHEAKNVGMTVSAESG